MIKNQQQQIIGMTKKSRQFLLIVTAVSFLFFLFVANPSKYYFLNDDFEHIPLAANGHFIFGTFLRPVTDILLWIDNYIWGKNAFGYHLTSLLIHLANTIFIFFLANLFFQKYTSKENVFIKSWAVSVLFLVYAFHSEPLFWVICRSGSISTFFFLLACICYLKRHDFKKYFLLSLLFFGICLFTYESTWVYPAIVFFISLADVVLKKVKRKKELLYLIITSFFFCLYLIYAKLQTGVISTDYTMHNFIQFNPLHLFYNYNALIARCFLPYMNNSKLFLLLYIAIVLCIIIAILFIIKKKKSNILLWLLFGCFLISPLPAISLGIDTHTSESERYIYLPSVFCILLIIEIIFLLIKNIKTFFLFYLIIAIANGFALYQSAHTYRFAGSVIKKSLQFINNSTMVNTIFIINKPLQYNGAVMFRAGLKDALNWVAPLCKYEKIDTLSSYKYLNVSDSFTLKDFNIEDGIKLIPCVFLKDKNDNYTITVNEKIFSFRPSKDMILYWNENELIKIK